MSLTDLPSVTAAHPEVALMLAQLDDGTAEWRENLEEPTVEQIVWQPFPGGHSIGALMLHIADVEAWWLHTVVAGAERTEEEHETLLSEETDQYAVCWPTPPAQSFAWYLAQLDTVRAKTKALLRDLDPWAITTREDGRTYTTRWALSHVIAHESYHGGQAVLLALIQTAGTAEDNGLMA